jgi:hypothetical protein
LNRIQEQNARLYHASLTIYTEMAVQTKTNAGSRPRQKKEINWTQVGVVAFCVLIVVMCIISFGGLEKLFQQGGAVSSGVIEIGDTADVEYTMYIGETPMVTSSYEVFQAANASQLPAVTANMRFVAGIQTNETVYVPTGSEEPFRMFPSEMNQISSGVIGLGINETRTLASSGSAYTSQITPADAAAMGIDYANWTIGSMGNLNFVDTAADGNETVSIRPALVTAKTDEAMTLQYGYDTIGIRLVAGYRT